MKVLVVDLWDTLIFEKTKGSSRKNRIKHLKNNYGYTDSYWEARYCCCQKIAKEAEKKGLFYSDVERIGYLLAEIDTSNEFLVMTKKAFDNIAEDNEYEVNKFVLSIINDFRRKNVKIVLLSNTGFIDVNTTKKILEKYKLIELFDEMFFSGELNFGKPSPMFYNVMLFNQKCDVEDIIFVCNSVFFDVMGARNVNISNMIVFNNFLEE